MSLKGQILKKAGALAIMLATAAAPAAASRRPYNHPHMRAHFRAASRRSMAPLDLTGLWAAPAVAVFDHATRLPLYVGDQHKITDTHDMASTTKMMTAVLFADYMRARGNDWTMPVRITPADYALPGGAANAIGDPRRGVTMTARELLLAMMVRSCNGAANAAARIFGDGDRAAGVAMMNARAREWGMAGTRYANAAGWKDPGHYSDIADMAVPLRHIVDDPHYAAVAEASRTKSFRFGGVPYENHNHLLGTFDGMAEGKTGWTNGFSIVASAVRGGHRLDICVLGDRAPKHRDRLVVDRLTEIFAHYEQYLARALGQDWKRQGPPLAPPALPRAMAPTMLPMTPSAAAALPDLTALAPAPR